MPRRINPFLLMLLAAPAGADPTSKLDDVVVIATRSQSPSLDIPASVDRVDGATLRAGLGVNLSESLGAVPGLSVQNRQNYAQDLQLSIRGFGARSSFGARGLRLYADGIPATMPDGQGQYSHFDLAGADRIEVLRGPFSALYGNSAGGVIAIYTADAPRGGATTATMDAGALEVRRYALRHGGDLGGANFSIDAAHFSTGGYRDHSRAERNTANAKLRVELAPQTRLTLVGNIVATPAIEDPLGLTAAQLAADPRQAGTGALLYNTRKSLVQEQVGAVLQVDLGEHDDVTLSTYAGHRRTTQFQAILQSVELASATHPGGVIDLARDYRGGELRFADRRSPFGTSLAVTGGITFDSLDEARRGYFNFVGSELGVLGSLRRDEANRVQGLDEFLQAEWAPAARWRLVGGVRHSDVRITSRNHLSLANPTAIGYAATNPVAGVTFRLRAGASLYASYGRGFETPTLNDLAYRSTNGSLTGLNTALQPARSDNYEIGAKVSAGEVRANFAAFQIRTENELAIKANSGGRSVLENIGATRRRGAELAVSASLPRSLTGTLAYTYLHARTLAPYLACAAVPCTPVTVPAGSRLPAVPASAVYAALAWHHPDERASIGVEVVGRSGIYADDRNLAFASGYWTTNLHLALRQTTAHWAFSEVVRLDNLFDRRYVGTVIVNESNGRYYEPSPGRTAYLLLNASFR